MADLKDLRGEFADPVSADEVAKPSGGWDQAAYRAKFRAGDYRDDAIRQEVERNYHFHEDPAPNRRWMKTREIAEELWPGQEFDNSLLIRVGRVIAQLEREQPALQTRMSGGYRLWFMPPHIVDKWRRTKTKTVHGMM